MGMIDACETTTAAAPRSYLPVSVVIPTFNRSASLERLLVALALSNEPVGGIEVIVVDDGSTDDTRAVVAAAGVRYLYQRNSGPGAARERGWRAAAGDVIVFMDDDVIPEREAIQRMVAALEHADGVGAVIHPLNRKPMVAHYMHMDDVVNHHVVQGEVRWLITAAAAFRRQALENVNGFDPAFPRAAGEDVDLTLRLLEAGCTLRLESSAIVYHDHRMRFRQLLGTCYRYGTAYRLLASRHQAHRADRRRSALLRLSPIEWTRLYQAYRREASAMRSVTFLLLHAVVALPYGVGVLRGGQRTLLEPSRVEVELAGRPIRLGSHALVDEGHCELMRSEEGAPAA
jgi:GT2 family glycosyltransferase